MTAALLCLCALQASASYDILYLRRPDQRGINAARLKVAHILGPDVARRLRVVKDGGGYALIYDRHGDLGSAKAVARSHKKMLARAGLPAPVPVKSEDAPKPQPAPAAKASPAAQPAPVPAAPEAATEAKAQPEAQAASPAPQTEAAVQPAVQPAPQTVRQPAPTLNEVAFEARLGQYLNDLRKSGKIKKDERTAWAVYDLTDNAKLAGINEESLLQTASLMKPFIALAYFHEVQHGRQQYTDKARRLMVEMIRDSDNAAADWFMRLLGGPAATEKLLKQNYGHIFRDIYMVEYIPRNGRTYQNKASVRDYMAFLHSLWEDRIPYSDEIKRVMMLPKRNRLTTSARGMPHDTEVYDKTGTTSRLCGDMGILVARRSDGRRFPYIVIGLIEKTSPASRYFSWMRNRGDIIRRVSVMAYEEIASRHHFNAPDAFTAEAQAPAQPAQ